jgi:hypothetical protein
MCLIQVNMIERGAILRRFCAGIAIALEVDWQELKVLSAPELIN